MDTLKDIKTYICDMLVYCDVISSKDSSVQSKVAFTNLMGNVAKRIAEKCDKLEKELENDNQRTERKRTKTEVERTYEKAGEEEC